MENESTHISDSDGAVTPEPLTSDPPLAPKGISSTISNTDSLLNRQVGNFEIITILGRGGFGAVYKARDVKLGRFVAIKFLHNPLDSTRRILFEREAKALAALGKAAGIVEVYEWGEVGAQNYIVLEFVDGSTEALLREHPCGLPIARALSIAADCAEALQSAHAAGILHRDIKPPNILVELSTGRAKVADFGLARLAEESGEFTLAGGLSGSPPYMSPEQASVGDLDGRSDIFSLGVTLYELLCGERPFVGASSGQVMEKIRRNDRIPLRDRRPDFPNTIHVIVDKAMAHSPTDRYQTAGEFAQDLRAALGALDETELVDTRSLRPVRPFSVRRRMAIMISALAVAVAGVLLWRFMIPTMAPPNGAELSDPGIAFAQAKKEVEAGDFESALALFKELKSKGGEGNRLVIDAYIKLAEEKTEASETPEVLSQAQRLGEKIRANSPVSARHDGWTSRPFSFFLLPSETAESTYVTRNDLVPVFDQALDAAFKSKPTIDYVDRTNLKTLLAEQELSADLSTKSGQLALGNFIGARFVVAGKFLSLTPPEKFRLDITDVETTKFVPAPTLVVDDFSTVDDLLLAAVDSLPEALRSSYPLQARLYLDNGVPAINLGTNTGVQTGMRFDIRPDPEGAPVDAMMIVVRGAPGTSKSTVTLEGLALENVPKSPEAAWYVRQIEAAAPPS